jgi:chromosome segregation ATPase
MFSRRGSKEPSVSPPPAGTPPSQIIDELKGAVADLKDELETAQQAKRYAYDNLKKQIEGTEKLELELTGLRKELEESKNSYLILLAKQSAEVPVMTAPSPNGSSKLRIDLDGDIQVVSTTEGESIINQLFSRVKELETDSARRESAIQELEQQLRDSVGSQEYLSEIEKWKSAQLAGEESAKRVRELELLIEKNLNRVSHLELEVRERDDEIERLVESAKSLENRIDTNADTKNIVESLKERISVLEGQLVIEKEISSQVEVIEDELRAKSEQVSELEDKLEEYRRFEIEVSSLREELVFARESAEKESGRISKSENEKSELKNRILELERELEDMKLKNFDINTRNQEMKSELLGKKTQIHEETENQILELVTQVGELRVLNSELGREKEELNQQLERVREEENETTGRLEKIRKQFKEKLSESSSILAKSIEATLEARREAAWWKHRYESDMRSATAKLNSLLEGGEPAVAKRAASNTDSRLPRPTREVVDELM